MLSNSFVLAGRLAFGGASPGALGAGACPAWLELDPFAEAPFSFAPEGCKHMQPSVTDHQQTEWLWMHAVPWSARQQSTVLQPVHHGWAVPLGFVGHTQLPACQP